MSNFDKNKNLNPTDFILFVPENESVKNQSHLKTFINVLNYFKMKKPFKFSYIDTQGQLILDLSLRENILLDSTDHALLDDKDTKWKDLLLKHENKALVELVNSIDNLEVTAKNATAQELKVASLVKALLNRNDYLFLESPENFLTTAQLKTFKTALQHFNKANSSIVFIHSSQQQVWKNIINKQLLFSKNQRFILRPVVQYHLKEQLLTRAIKPKANTEKYQGLHFINVDNGHKKAA